MASYAAVDPMATSLSDPADQIWMEIHSPLERDIETIAEVLYPLASEPRNATLQRASAKYS